MDRESFDSLEGDMGGISRQAALREDCLGQLNLVAVCSGVRMRQHNSLLAADCLEVPDSKLQQGLLSPVHCLVLRRRRVSLPCNYVYGAPAHGNRSCTFRCLFESNMFNGTVLGCATSEMYARTYAFLFVLGGFGKYGDESAGICAWIHPYACISAVCEEDGRLSLRQSTTE